MRRRLILVALLLSVLILVVWPCGAQTAAEALEGVKWVYIEDFGSYAVDEYPHGKWIAFSNRSVSWSVVEFPESENGRALLASNRDDKQNRLILAVDIPQAKDGQIIVQTRLWVDLFGLPGIDLWHEEMTWPNYMSVHPWNLGIFATSRELRPYDQVVVFNLSTATADVYIDGELVKSGMSFRDGQVPPTEGIYRVGLSFAGADGSSDVYWEFVKVGVRSREAGEPNERASEATRMKESLWISEVKYQDPSTGIYLGSPSILRLSNGDILVTHDYFGPNAPKDALGRSNMTSVYVSRDDGLTWQHLTDLTGIYWASLFEHRGDVYLLGNSSAMGGVVIRKSSDGGKTWTEAVDEKSGVILRPGNFGSPPRYHGAPVPVVEVNGRLYRAFENAADPAAPGMRGYRAFVLSVDSDADLLDAANWRKSNELVFDPSWDPPGANPTTGWIEGNVVEGPDGRLWNILRVNSTPYVDRAAMVEIHDDGARVSFDPDNFIKLPGGQSKFVIRRDEETGLYWMLTNNNTSPAHSSQRNILSLYVSADLRNWYHAKTVLEDDQGLPFSKSVELTGFQYPDFQFDGDHIIYLSRTAYDGAPNYHDSNRITFGRIENFRELTPEELL